MALVALSQKNRLGQNSASGASRLGVVRVSPVFVQSSARPSTRPSAKPGEIKVVAENRKARFDYLIEDTFEAGIELRGSEVKSLRKGDVNLKDSYVTFRNGEAYLQNAHISVYKASSYLNHEPERLRKLLLKSSELFKIERAIQEKGYTCVPLRIYFRGGWAKLEIALARGKKAADKRESSKARDADRELAAAKRKAR